MPVKSMPPLLCYPREETIFCACLCSPFDDPSCADAAIRAGVQDYRFCMVENTPPLGAARATGCCLSEGALSFISWRSIKSNFVTSVEDGEEGHGRQDRAARADVHCSEIDSSVECHVAHKTMAGPHRRSRRDLSSLGARRAPPMGHLGGQFLQVHIGAALPGTQRQTKRRRGPARGQGAPVLVTVL
jgi:hypothetical protein